MKLIIFAALLVISYRGTAQKIYNDHSMLKQGQDSATYLSKAAFNKKVKQVFGQLATGQSSSGSVANAAAADVTGGKLDFDGNFGISNRLLGSVAASGKIDNSIGELFNGFKLNSSTSLDVRLHLRLLTRFYFTQKDAAELGAKRNYLELRRTSLQNNILNTRVTRQAFVNMKALRLQLLRDSMRNNQSRVNKLVTSGDTSDRSEHLRLAEEFYRMVQDSAAIRLQQDSVNLLLRDPENNSLLTKIYSDSINKEIEKAELDAPFSSIHLIWLTARFTPSRQKFYLYDSLQNYGSQVIDTAFTATYYGLEFSYYYWTHKKFSFYGNMGGGYERTNNLDTLNTVSVDDTRTVAAGNQARKIENKYNAYSGDYQESEAWKLYMNFYFFGAGNKWAFHLFPEWLFWRGTTITNLGLGFVVSFKSKKDDKTIINAEPYFQLSDIGNRTRSKFITTQNRNSIGLRIGLPINPPELK